LIELPVNLLLESGGTTPQKVDLIVDQFINAELARLAVVYKFYGYTQG
jgi:hypothetical protein